VIARSGFIALPVFIENIPVSCFPLFFQAVSNAEKTPVKPLGASLKSTPIPAK
jgi:hypothetical protein